MQGSWTSVSLSSRLGSNTEKKKGRRSGINEWWCPQVEEVLRGCALLRNLSEEAVLLLAAGCETVTPKHCALHPKPSTFNPKPQTLCPKPQTLNHKP